MYMLRQGCSLSMLHRTCKNCMGVLGWMDWAWPISYACLFILSPVVLRRTLSHIWCKLNLCIFLLSVGLLTLIYIDSLIVLGVPWSSPHYLEIILSGSVPCVVAMVMYRGGFLQVFFESFSKGHRGFPLCILDHMQGLHIGTSRWSHFSFPWGPCP